MKRTGGEARLEGYIALQNLSCLKKQTRKKRNNGEWFTKERDNRKRPPRVYKEKIGSSQNAKSKIPTGALNELVNWESSGRGWV